VVLGASSPEEPRLGNARSVDELLERARLADAGFPDQREESPAARARFLQTGEEPTDLGLAPDEDAPRRCGLKVLYETSGDRP